MDLISIAIADGHGVWLLWHVKGRRKPYCLLNRVFKICSIERLLPDHSMRIVRIANPIELDDDLHCQLLTPRSQSPARFALGALRIYVCRTPILTDKQPGGLRSGLLLLWFFNLAIASPLFFSHDYESFQSKSAPLPRQAKQLALCRPGSPFFHSALHRC